MFISHTHKLIFFEVPRTGSRSISQALTQLDPRSPTAVVRSLKRNLYHYHVFDQNLADQHPDYAIIAAHRNPYERIRSHYKYRKQRGNPDELKRFSFTNYIDWVCLGKPPFDIGAAMIDRPITELLPCDRVDHFLRFDQLEEDWQVLSEKLQVSLPQLERINYSSADFDEQCVYTQNLASKVALRFASDFEYFDYPL